MQRAWPKALPNSHCRSELRLVPKQYLKSLVHQEPF